MVCNKSDERASCGQLRKRLIDLSTRMTGSRQVSSYRRMDGDDKKEARDNKDKENNYMKKSEDKKAKKKRSWKRFRQIAFSTCRYIGLGVAYMSPATVNSAPDYYVDPKQWNKSFSPTYQQRMHTVGPHWTSNMMFASTW